MKRFLGKVTVAMLLTLALGGAVVVASLLQAVEVLVPPSFSMSLATVQNVSAKAWLVFDLETGQTLYSFNENKSLPIASITKLPAAKMMYEQGDIWATTMVSWADVAEEGRAGKLTAGETYLMHTLLFPLLLESSNDAAHVFLRTHPELVDEMNAYANHLGLTATTFADTSGLSDDNVSSASDLRTVLRDMYEHSRQLIAITTLPAYYSLDNGWLNNSPYIDIPEYRGGKHGYTYAAGYTAAVLFEEPLQNGSVRTLGYILLGSGDLRLDMKLLRDHVQQHVRFE
ncbi:D-alanyl-D-alanine carboxypeptidase [Candidatus Kaiserbacteria bacterium]|nr:D-alanyl-D-alanine carboxypeptidase [Candidatus Kaiserbacteria bacterium]MCB9812023.1 D-alanyl-D-alanine carboxypeptidase [Candidatus Nomurabacteria bacterium]